MKPPGVIMMIVCDCTPTVQSDGANTVVTLEPPARMARRGATHTYVTLELSSEAYDEIRAKLAEAGYDHAFNRDGEIDMHGLAVTRGAEPPPCKHETFWPLSGDRPFRGARPPERTSIACLDCRRVLSIPGDWKRTT